MLEIVQLSDLSLFPLLKCRELMPKMLSFAKW